MPFATHPAHRDFFQKNQFIEFEGLFSKEDANSLKEFLDQALSLRYHRNKNFDPSPTPFDLWREDLRIQKKIYKSSLSSIAKELFQIDKLKLAFDLYFSPQTPPPQKALTETTSLQAFSSLNPLVGGMLLQLTDLTPTCNNFPFPSAAGNVLVFSPSLPISWDLLLESQPSSTLLLSFGTRQTLFLHGNLDPNASNLKKLGYAFGDTLKEPLHPTLHSSPYS